jgi:hypothetical protein
MKSDNLLVIVAVIAVVSSMVGLLITYNSISHTRDFITGFANTETGIVNITIQDLALIEIISAAGYAGNKTIDWGSGYVTALDYADLVTNGTVAGGTWGEVSQGFIIRNSGNRNVTVNITSEKNAANFIGGAAGGGPIFRFNVTNLPGNESCIDYEVTPGVYYDMNTSDTILCNNFGPAADNRLIRLDFWVRVPSDALATGKGSVVSLNYEAAA